jgi:hypothetical protein
MDLPSELQATIETSAIRLAVQLPRLLDVIADVIEGRARVIVETEPTGDDGCLRYFVQIVPVAKMADCADPDGIVQETV